MGEGTVGSIQSEVRAPTTSHQRGGKALYTRKSLLLVDSGARSCDDMIEDSVELDNSKLGSTQQ